MACDLGFLSLVREGFVPGLLSTLPLSHVSPVPCRPVLLTHPDLVHALSELEPLSPAEECRQASAIALCSLALLLSSLLSAEIPFFLLAQSHQRCSVARRLSPSFHPTSSPRSCVCSPPTPACMCRQLLGLQGCAAALEPAASQVWQRCQETKPSHGLEKRDFSLGVRKRDSTKCGKLPRRGFSPGSKATGRQTCWWGLIPSFMAASPAASDSHLVSRSQPYDSPPARQKQVNFPFRIKCLV